MDTKEYKQEKARRIEKSKKDFSFAGNRTVYYGSKATDINAEYIMSNNYRIKFRGLTDFPKVDDEICNCARSILKDRSGTEKETLALFDKNTGHIVVMIDNTIENNSIRWDEKSIEKLEKAKDSGISLIALHNHPQGLPPTVDDCISAYNKNYSFGIAAGHNGEVFTYYPSDKQWNESQCTIFHENVVSLYCRNYSSYNDICDAWMEIMSVHGFEVRRIK